MVSLPRCRTILMRIGALLALLPAAACSQMRTQTLVDLTHAFDEETVFWPGNKPFHWEQTQWGMTAAGYWYASGDFSTSEHGGTHLDAPIHFGQGRNTVDQIPLEQLIGSAIVIDVRPQCNADPDYELRVEDILQWESRHGRIRKGALVFMRSGWDERWPDRKRYLGSDMPDDPHSLHFPGFSREAADFLLAQRAVRAVGIDTASVDPGRSRDFPVHRVLNGADVYTLENVAGLDRLPPAGFTVIALPMKIRGGTGGPVRILAILP